MVFGWFFLLDLDYNKLSKHIVSSLFFVSNITYWRESGYFGSGIYDNWLIHTWSLSAEWQFYIIYPIILFFVFRFIPSPQAKKVIICLTVLGFIFSALITPIKPDAAYYLLPTRAWEMMIGGIAFFTQYLLQLKIQK